MMQNGYKTYQRVEVQTSDPTKIIVMLYEGAIKNLNQAIGHFEAKRNEEGSGRVNKTLDIVHYLSSTLDFEKGGEIAQNLSKLYDYVRDTLALANINADAGGIRDSIKVLSELLEGWQAIVVQNNATPISADIQAPEEPPNLSMVG